MTPKRFWAEFNRNHIGIAIRWNTQGYYQLEITLLLPFVTMFMGLGRAR